MTIIFLTFCGNGYSITVQRGGIWGGGLPLSRKNIMRYKLNYLHHVRTQCAIWCFHAPVCPPSKISTAVNTACERIVPSKSFLGAVYNRGSPFPQIDIIRAMAIVWRVRGKIIRSVLCNIVRINCAQCNAHT